MGNESPISLPSQKTSVQTSHTRLKISYHRHENTPELIRIFRLFLREPYHFIHSIDIESVEQNCCSKTVLRIKSPEILFNLEMLLNVKRKNRGFFVEKEIWYVIRTVINVMMYMQSAEVVLGVINPRIFQLDQGRYLTFDILHLLPQNEHEKIISLHNYYSPQKIHQMSEPIDSFHNGIDPYKSEVFAFGLLILELATCPASKPKFHKSSLKELLWNQIIARYEICQQRYSDKLTQLLEMMLREDTRVRPDWNYLRIWLMRNEAYIDIAPCIFWAI